MRGVMSTSLSFARGVCAPARSVVDDAITHNNYTEWNGGGWLKRDYDTFLIVGAFKKDGKVDLLSVNTRFARSDVAAAVKGKWTYAHWARRGLIREANVFK